MAYRSTTKKKTDKKIFKRTATETKRINIAPKVMRGGIKL